MTLTIQKTMTDLWIARGEVTHFATRLDEAGRHDDARALAEAGYGLGRALLDLSNLVEKQACTIEEVAAEGVA